MKKRRLKKFIKDFINKALSVINDKIMVDIENLFGNVSDLEKYINNDFSIDSKNNEKIYKSNRDNFINLCDLIKILQMMYLRFYQKKLIY
jgi:hypothetical protein